MANETLYAGYSAEEIFEALEAKPLTTKKNILDYIASIRKLAKDGMQEAEVKKVYEWIEKQIEALGQDIKVNTMVYLKNELRNNLGKFAAPTKGEENTFIRFYKQTFANQVKTKAYTYALVDLTRLNESSVIETLKTINTYCLRNKLSAKEKEDIMPMIKRIVDTQNLRLINQLRSMEGIRKNFRIKVVEENKRLIIKAI
ncbi:MAG: hypothetical protein E7231_01950 [Cellulosilyticum sp.]|nr:hypothetical protein [Cellulosilyticum sp.]